LRGFMIFFTIFSYTIFHMYKRPHGGNGPYALEQKMHIVLIFVLFLNLILIELTKEGYTDNASFYKFVALIFKIFLEYGFMLWLLWRIFWIKLKAVAGKQVNGMKKYLKRHFPSIFFWMKIDTFNFARCHNNFKRWRKLIRD